MSRSMGPTVEQLSIGPAILAPPAAQPEPLRLALDPSPTSTGFCRGRARADESGTRLWCQEQGVSIKNGRWVGKVGRAWSQFLQREIDRGVQEIVIEQPATPSPQHFNLWHSGFVIHQFMKALEMAEIAGLPWYVVPTSMLKRWALGEGHGLDDARHLIGWCRQVGYATGSVDEAVAIALLEYRRAHP